TGRFHVATLGRLVPPARGISFAAGLWKSEATCAMTIYFIQTESTSEERFREKLREHDLHFVATAADVGEDAEMLVILFWTRIDGAFLAAHPKVRFVATRSSGYDHI